MAVLYDYGVFDVEEGSFVISVRLGVVPVSGEWDNRFDGIEVGGRVGDSDEVNSAQREGSMEYEVGQRITDRIIRLIGEVYIPLENRRSVVYGRGGERTDGECRAGRVD